MNPPAEPSPGTIVLEYRADAPPRAARRTDWLFLIIGVAGVAAPFVPFTFGVGPAEVIWRVRELSGGDKTGVIFLTITVPFFLPLPLWALRLRGMLFGRATRVERLTNWTAAFVTTAGTLTLFGVTLSKIGDMEWQGRAMFAAIAAVLAGGGVVVWRLWRRGAEPDAVVTAALTAPYVANAGLCLFAFLESRGPGWYLTAVAASAALGELVLFAVGRRGYRA